ncbi:hypothetical protein KKG41_01080 [Patescibacteria group bacterium]|nr:hypothetical protein [Patescibacteria group bacterium]
MKESRCSHSGWNVPDKILCGRKVEHPLCDFLGKEENCPVSKLIKGSQEVDRQKQKTSLATETKKKDGKR